MGWTFGVLGFDSQWELGIFFFTTASRTALGPTQHPIQRVPGSLSLGVKRPWREADHSPPSSAEVKNALSYTYTPQYAFMAWCLVKHRGNFSFTVTSFFGCYELFLRKYAFRLNLGVQLIVSITQYHVSSCRLVLSSTLGYKTCLRMDTISPSWIHYMHMDFVQMTYEELAEKCYFRFQLKHDLLSKWRMKTRVVKNFLKEIYYQLTKPN
jgi:hypothetical protein